ERYCLAGVHCERQVERLTHLRCHRRGAYQWTGGRRRHGRGGGSETQDQEQDERTDQTAKHRVLLSAGGSRKVPLVVHLEGLMRNPIYTADFQEALRRIQGESAGLSRTRRK